MLNYALATNALFSATCGTAMIVYRTILLQHFPGPEWIWLLLGTGLLLFSLILVMMLAIPALKRWLTLQVVIADVVWIVSSLVLLAMFQSSISVTGGVLIAITNVSVALLAGLQLMGYRIEVHSDTDLPGHKPITEQTLSS